MDTLAKGIVRKPRATFALLVHVPGSRFHYRSGNILIHVSVHPTTHAWRKIMDASFVEFLRAGGVNQQLRKEVEPSKLESKRESEREFEREPGT